MNYINIKKDYYVIVSYKIIKELFVSEFVKIKLRNVMYR